MGKEKFNQMIKSYLISILIGVILGIAGTITMIHYTQKEVKLSCPPPVCPKCPASIEVEKLKDFRGKFVLNQTYEIGGDSSLRINLLKDIEALLLKQKISRCK
jgi:hypothetical protein